MDCNLHFCLVRRTLAFLMLGLLVSFASAEWNEKVLYSFQGIPDGAVPIGGVVFDKAGNLYGATNLGGASSCAPLQCGTVFQLAPPAEKGDPWTETVLHVFQGNSSGDGSTPLGGVILDQAGNLYGTTSYGGTGACTLLGGTVGCGTVYEMTPPAQPGGAWTESVLYSFQGGKDGYVPWGDLVFDSSGNLYGATQFGGGKGTTCDEFYGGNCGAVFELSPPKKKGGKWKEKVLYSFKGVEAGEQFGDGASPNGGLVLDSTGAIYGTTYYGGYNCPHHSGQGCGTVFKLARPVKDGVWAETVLYRFKSIPDGALPGAGLTFDGSGGLYGTTTQSGGGNFGSGTVFRLELHSNGKWMEKILYSFQDNGDGGAPRGAVVFDSKGNLYGTATEGGTGEAGTLFRLEPAGKSWAFAALYEFGVRPDGAYPTGLTFDSGGDLYGTTQYGGSGQACESYGCGTVFTAKP